MSTLFVFLSLAYLSLAYHKKNQTVQTKPKKMVVHSTKTPISLGICLLWVFMGCCTTKPLKMAVDWDWTNLGNKWKIIFHAFCWLTILFQIILFEKKLCNKQLWSRSVALSRHFIGPNMGPNCFQRSLYNLSWRRVKFTKTTFIRLKHNPQLWKVEGASVCASVCPFKKIS